MSSAEAQAAEPGFPVGRKQLRDIKAQVADELRARAFTRLTTTRAWIDSRSGWFVTDAAGAPRAESMLETLVATLESFVPEPLEGARSPHTYMAIKCSLSTSSARR